MRISDWSSDVCSSDLRQLRFGDGNGTTIIAMNDGYGRTPITLARDAPIPQTPYRGALPPALSLRAIDDSMLGGLHIRAIQKTRIYQMAGPGISFGQDGSIFLPLHSNHAFNGQHIFECKIQIALVVRGDAHDCPGAIVHQHEIGDEKRQLPLLVEGMNDR